MAADPPNVLVHVLDALIIVRPRIGLTAKVARTDNINKIPTLDTSWHCKNQFIYWSEQCKLKACEIFSLLHSMHRCINCQDMSRCLTHFAGNPYESGFKWLNIQFMRQGPPRARIMFVICDPMVWFYTYGIVRIPTWWLFDDESKYIAWNQSTISKTYQLIQQKNSTICLRPFVVVQT